ncbi:hypothetical protein NK6_9087 [Bradyrhizobium diazoefficiens]|uniref:DUF2147 domain-containing protein n=1 Tax=Bradyrhizobium diazoefficiens TaxID=1355477 RepID=A0A0E3VX87_9BRAD|nr:hypothetical protein NK6_9087 [Bradyrhizobium diazoefficiens]
MLHRLIRPSCLRPHRLRPLLPSSSKQLPWRRPAGRCGCCATRAGACPAPVQSAAVAPPAPAAAPTRDLNSPLGIWLTEEKEGKVRIEQCGNNLCGYSVDSKSNQNGEQVLINMKPGKDQKWSGRILDPNTGSTYDSTIAMKGTDRLRVQGCAFGGMFCGGQTWTRVN